MSSLSNKVMTILFSRLSGDWGWQKNLKVPFLSMEEVGGSGGERHLITVMTLLERVTWLEGMFRIQQKAKGVV